MMIYRLFRYFIVVFFLMFLVLFFVRGTFSPFPYFNTLFDAMEGYYLSLGKQPQKERTPDIFFDRLKDAGDRLLVPLQKSMDMFLKDPEFPLALEMLKSGDVDDWEYLVRTRLISDRDFHDLTVTYENRMIYRYENAVVNAPLVFTNIFDTVRGRFTVTFYYDTDPILSILNDQLIPLAVKVRSDIFYSPSLTRVFPNFLSQVTDSTLLSPMGVAIENDTQTLYYYKIQQNLQTPILLFTLETLPSSPPSYAKILFFVIIVILIIAIFLLDRLICNFFILWQRKALKNREFAQYRNTKSSSKDGSNLDWLDDLAKSYETQPSDDNPSSDKVSSPEEPPLEEKND